MNAGVGKLLKFSSKSSKKRSLDQLEEGEFGAKKSKKLLDMLIPPVEAQELAVDVLPFKDRYKKGRLKQSEIPYTPINRVCFRGDNRHPIKFKIFETGLLPRPYDKQKDHEALSYPFASNNEVVVALSKRLSIAALFPINDAMRGAGEFETWLYIVYVEKGFDVHSHGIIYFQISETERLNKLIDENYKSRLEGVYKTLSYAEEIITPSIPPSNIIGAVKIKRVQLDPDSDFPTGTYQLLEVAYNKHCKVSPKIISSIKDFIAKEKALGAQPISKPSSAYSPRM